MKQNGMNDQIITLIDLRAPFRLLWSKINQREGLHLETLQNKSTKRCSYFFGRDRLTFDAFWELRRGK